MTGSWLSVAAAFGWWRSTLLRCDESPGQGQAHPLDGACRKGSAAARRAKRLVEHLDEYSPLPAGDHARFAALGWIGEPAFAT